MTTEDLCAVCQIQQGLHLELEKTGFKKHQFTTTTGDLRPVHPEKKKSDPKPTTIVQIVPAPDLALRSMLRAKGFLTDEDIMAFDDYPQHLSVRMPDAHGDEVGRSGDRGDRQDRPEKGSS